MTTPEIQELIRLVEKKYRKSLHTSTDFDEFSLHLLRNQFGNVSPSTLKRLWGYVNDIRKPRRNTLDTLSLFIGHGSYDIFVEWLKKSSAYNSSFFTAYQITGNELETGDKLEIGWTPNRLLTLVYKGDNLYEVVKAENSKLRAGDQFLTGCFIKEQPLYLPYIIRDGEHTPAFIAGRNGGITCINVFKGHINSSEKA